MSPNPRRAAQLAAFQCAHRMRRAPNNMHDYHMPLLEVGADAGVWALHKARENVRRWPVEGAFELEMMDLLEELLTYFDGRTDGDADSEGVPVMNYEGRVAERIADLLDVDTQHAWKEGAKNG